MTAHLLIPGYTHTHTGMTARGPEKPDTAWSAEQVVDFMPAGVKAGNFYILCPDNETTRKQDTKRVALGRSRRNREPTRAVALASRLEGRFRTLRGGVTTY